MVEIYLLLSLLTFIAISTSYQTVRVWLALRQGRLEGRGLAGRLFGVVFSIAILMINAAILGVVAFTFTMKSGGASGIPFALALFFGLPALGLSWLAFNCCFRKVEHKDID